jgi:glycosyltransferase involved in cell wall biosynthesis
METPWERLPGEAGHAALFRATLDIIRRWRIDVVSGHGRMFGVYLAARRAGVPLFWTFHGADAPAYRRRLRFRLIARLYSLLGRDGNLRLVGVSGFVSQNLRALFGARARISTVLNGFAGLDSLLSLPPPHIADKLRIGFVGRLERLKGVWDLPLIALLLRRRGVPFQLTVFGGGSQQELLASAFRAAGFGDAQVVLAGYEPDPLRIYSAVDGTVQLCPREWLGSTIIESCAAARPVVAYAAGGNLEILRDGGGCLVPVCDVEAVAAALERWWRHPEELARAGQRARTMAAARFASQRMVREYVEMFRQGLSTTGVAAAAQAARPDSRPAFPLVANGLSSQENQHVE